MNERKTTRRFSSGGYAFNARATHAPADTTPQMPKRRRVIEYRDPDTVPISQGKKKRKARQPKPAASDQIAPAPSKRRGRPPKAPAAARPPKPTPAPKTWEPMKRPTVILNPGEEVGCDVQVALTGSYPVGAAEARMKAGWRQGQCLTCGRWRWGDEPCSKARYAVKPRIRL